MIVTTDLVRFVALHTSSKAVSNDLSDLTPSWSTASSVTAGTATATTTATARATTAATTTATATVATTAITALGLLLRLLLEELSEAGVVRLNGKGLGPEIGSEVLVGAGESVVGCLEEILGSSGVTRSLSVAILNTSESKHLLGNGGADNTGTTRSGDKLDTDGGALARDLAWDGMDMTDLVTPIAAADGHKAELSVNKGALDSNLDFLGDLDAETNVASHITDSDNSLKAGALTGLSLLLDGDDLHNIILELVLGALDELVNDLALLDGNRVSVDLLKRLDVVSLDETAKLGLGDPLVLGGTATAAGATTATASTATSEAAALTAVSTSFTSGCCFSHR